MLLFYNILKKFVTQCQYLEHIFYLLLVQQQAKQNTRVLLQQTANYTISGYTTAAAAVPVVLISSVLVIACSITLSTWCLFTV
jgi:hypothetical protein